MLEVAPTIVATFLCDLYDLDLRIFDRQYQGKLACYIYFTGYFFSSYFPDMDRHTDTHTLYQTDCSAWTTTVKNPEAGSGTLTISFKRILSFEEIYAFFNCFYYLNDVF